MKNRNRPLELLLLIVLGRRAGWGCCLAWYRSEPENGCSLLRLLEPSETPTALRSSYFVTEACMRCRGVLSIDHLHARPRTAWIQETSLRTERPASHQMEWKCVHTTLRCSWDLGVWPVVVHLPQCIFPAHLETGCAGNWVLPICLDVKYHSVSRIV